RTLLRNVAAAAVVTLVTGAAWRLMAGVGSTTSAAPSAAGGGTATAIEPNPPPFDVKGIASEVTPTADFYTVSKNFIDPRVAVGGWRLKIDGLVDQPMELTYEQLTALPSSQGYYTLMCISNEVGGDLWGNA